MIKQPTRLLVFATAFLLYAVPCLAGIHYQAVTTAEADRGKPMVTEIEAWIDGEKAKIEFQESANPLAPRGTYLLTQDGGRTIYLVNPKNQTYSQWDIEGLMGLMGGLLQAMGGMGKFELSEPEIEKLLEEDGGTLVGLSTRHYRYRMAYDLDIKVIGIRQSSEVETVMDYWTTSELADVALGLWLRKEPPQTGDPNLDKLIRAHTVDMEGFPLKTVTVTTQRQVKKKKGKAGKETVTRSTLEVTSLRSESVPGSTFTLPAGYQETPMPMAPSAAGNPLKGLLGRNP